MGVLGARSSFTLQSLVNQMTYASAGGTSENFVRVNNQYLMCSVLSVGSYEVNGGRTNRLSTSEAVIPGRRVCHCRANPRGAAVRGVAHADIIATLLAVASSRAIADI